MASETHAETFVDLFDEYVNMMLEKNSDISLQEIYDTINLPKLLTCLSEQDQKRNLTPLTKLIEKIYHNAKTCGNDKVQCIVCFDDEEEEDEIKPIPEEYPKRFVNFYYEQIVALFENNPDLSFEESCDGIKLHQILRYINQEESKRGITEMIEEIYNSAKIRGGSNNIRCILSFI